LAKALPVIGVVALAAVGLLYWAASGAEDRRLDGSVMGGAGLEVWLEDNGVEVWRANPRLTPAPDEFSIAVVPIYDRDLENWQDQPSREEDRMSWTSPRNAEAWQLYEIMRTVPSLVILPKWRYGFAITGIAHEDTQLSPYLVNALLAQTALSGVKVLEPQNLFTEVKLAPYAFGDHTGGPVDVALFRAQLFDRSTLPQHCKMLVGTARGALLVRCAAKDGWSAAHYLSDPDLMNNHGLALAENATWALGLVAALRAGDTRPVYLALEPVPPGEPVENPEPHQRTAEDLSRFFAWPLSALWAMAGLVLALTAWRGLRRFGPVTAAPTGATENSRTAAIQAKARLLRLAGADQRMAGEFVRSHMSQIAAQVLGPGHGSDAGVQRWLQLVSRRNPGLGGELQAAIAAISTKDTLSPAELARRLETFRDLTRKATDAA
jgi:hypothetical protein